MAAHVERAGSQTHTHIHILSTVVVADSATLAGTVECATVDSLCSRKVGQVRIVGHSRVRYYDAAAAILSHSTPLLLGSRASPQERNFRNNITTANRLGALWYATVRVGGSVAAVSVSFYVMFAVCKRCVCAVCSIYGCIKGFE